MTGHDIYHKLQQGDIPLEELSSEDHLKLYDAGYAPYTLSLILNKMPKEIEKIRKKKVSNMRLESCIRNCLVTLDYLEEYYPQMTQERRFSIIYDISEGSFISVSNRSFYRNKFTSIAWFKLNLKKEIEEREVDVAYRRKRMKTIFEHIKFYEASQEFTENKKISYSPSKKAPKYQQSKRQTYQRDIHLNEFVLQEKNYCCEINKEHPTFLRQSNNTPYMEIHHLIPMCYQDQFEYSLDVPANMICLCSNCHREIHYGTRRADLLLKLYENRQNSLVESGLILKNINELYEMYDHHNLVK